MNLHFQDCFSQLTLLLYYIWHRSLYFLFHFIICFLNILFTKTNFSWLICESIKTLEINIIIIKKLLHLRNSHTEVSLRLTIPRILRALHRNASTRKCYLTNTADKVIYSVVQITSTIERHLSENLKALRTVITSNTSYK